MFGVALDERFDEGCFANLCAVSMIVNNRADFVYPRRTDDGDNDRRRFFWQTVDQGNVQSLFFDLDIREYRLDKDNKMYRTSCERAACFCRRPGLAKAKAFGFVPVPNISTRYHWKERWQRTPSVLFLFFRLPVRLICLVLHRRNGTTMRYSCSQVSSKYPIRSSNFPCQGPSGGSAGPRLCLSIRRSGGNGRDGGGLKPRHRIVAFQLLIVSIICTLLLPLYLVLITTTGFNHYHHSVHRQALFSFNHHPHQTLHVHDFPARQDAYVQRM